MTDSQGEQRKRDIAKDALDQVGETAKDLGGKAKEKAEHGVGHVLEDVGKTTGQHKVTARGMEMVNDEDHEPYHSEPEA